MKFFYWLMAILIVGTFVPSTLYLLVYAITGEDGAMQWARKFWNLSRVFTLGGLNILIWGHVIVAVWLLIFR
jgi:hypothetical protein